MSDERPVEWISDAKALATALAALDEARRERDAHKMALDIAAAIHQTDLEVRARYDALAARLARCEGCGGLFDLENMPGWPHRNKSGESCSGPIENLSGLSKPAQRVIDAAREWSSTATTPAVPAPARDARAAALEKVARRVADTPMNGDLGYITRELRAEALAALDGLTP